MQDKNNLQIADLILKWIDKNVGKTRVEPTDSVKPKGKPLPSAAGQ
jgi:hypothetical protein